MKHKGRMALACVLVLVLLVPLCFGCGDGKEEGTVTITIGEITDLTGISAPAIAPIHYLWEDMVRYYNEENLIPGVRLRLVAYDHRADPARYIPGYYWVKERGATGLICCIEQNSGQTLKPFAERDKIPIANLATTVGLIEPPGWVFCFANPQPWGMKALMKWISENDWDYTEGVPKIGFAGWSEVGGLEVTGAMKEYCQAHPNEFDWIGSYLEPLGTMTWAGEIDKLKNCDYVSSYVNPLGYLLNGFRDRGYGATFIDIGTAPSFTGLFGDLCGWKRLDGTLTGSVSLTWNEQTPIVNLAKELLGRYRSGQAEQMMHASHSYVGACQQVISILDILRAAVEKVGAANFDGQAFYDAAIKYQTSGSMWEGYPKWGFSETKRHLVDDICVYKFDAETESLVRVSDWLPATG